MHLQETLLIKGVNCINVLIEEKKIISVTFDLAFSIIEVKKLVT